MRRAGNSGSKRGQRRWRRWAPWLLSALLIALGAFGRWHAPMIEAHGEVHVLDGDTLRIGNREIRLFGIDAFEIDQRCEANGQRHDCGEAARSALERMTRDGVRCEGRRHDRYGRLLAVCFSGGADINGALVETGHALAWRRYSTDYVGLEERAKSRAAGAWAGEFEAPWTYREREGVENAR